MGGPEIAFVAFAGATYAGHQEQKKARRASENAAKVRAKIGRVKQQREKQEGVRRARIARAQIAAQAQAQGAEGSSAVAGAQSGVQGQLYSNISFLDRLQTLGDFVSAFDQSAAKHRERAKVFDTAANIAGRFTQSGGG